MHNAVPLSTLPLTLTDAEREEANAVRLAMEGRWLPRLGLALGALDKLQRDTNDTHQVFILGIAVNAGHFPRMLARFLADDSGLELLNRRAAINSSSVDYDHLRALPDTTLGGAYARFLDRHGLDPDLFRAPPGMPAAPAYLAQRMRQSHDIWHVLTGYEPVVADELALLAFTFAQTGAPAMGLLAVLGTLRFSFKVRGIFRHTWQGYRRGRDAKFLANVPWETMWELPIEDVRQELGVR